MKTILVFDPRISGHHLEYLAHLWRICENKTDCCYFFLVPHSFAEKQDMIGLSYCKTIKIVFLSEDECAKCNTGSVLKKAWYVSKTISRYVTRLSVSDVFLVSIMDCLPFLPFLLRSKIQVSGIVYGIYLYTWRVSSFVRKVEDIVKYQLFARSRVFRTVFILNDAASARKLNALYHTDKFTYLVDPYLPVTCNNMTSIRKEFGIANDTKLFIHFGSLGIRKGTMIVLDSLDLLTKEDIRKFAFILAGRVPNEIKEMFYLRIDEIKKKGVQLYINDSFCEYSFLGALCSECDAILVPYLDTARSSGIIGYASQFKKPVIAPASGLIGRLVKSYKLGYLIPSLAPSCLCEAYRTFDEKSFDAVSSSRYSVSHNVEAFSKTIRESF